MQIGGGGGGGSVPTFTLDPRLTNRHVTSAAYLCKSTRGISEVIHIKLNEIILTGCPKKIHFKTKKLSGSYVIHKHCLN